MRAAIAASFVALACGLAATPAVREFAVRRGLLDRGSTSRNVHLRPIPRLGGVAVVAAFFAAVLAALIATELHHAIEPRVAAALVGAVVIAGLGLYDDLRGVGASTKFAVQLGVALVAWGAGYRIASVALPLVGVVDLGLLGLPLTVVWISGVTNAVNLIDGLDALAGSVALIVLVALFSFAMGAGDPVLMLLTAALAGAVAGFLFFNVHPATIFMGDTGSMFIGFLLAVVSLESARVGTNRVALLAPVIALGYPIGDTLLAMARRALRGVPMFSADRQHIHHRLLSRGFSQRETALLLSCASACLCAVAFVVLTGRDAAAGAALAILAVVLAAAMRWLGFLDWRKFAALAEARRRNHQRLETVARIAAQLRNAADPEALAASLAEVGPALGVEHIEVKAHGLSWSFGASHKPNLRVVRYELRPEPASQEIQVAWERGSMEQDRDTEIAIERLCPNLRAALRRMNGALDRMQAPAPVNPASPARGERRLAVLGAPSAPLRTIVVGAGVAGRELARDLGSSPRPEHLVVGFVDPDPVLSGDRVAGLPVLGTIDDLPRLVDEHRARSVLLAAPTPAERVRRVLDVCSASKVTFRTGAGRGASSLRDLTPDDLLAGRDGGLDRDAIRTLVEGRRVLVTGAATPLGGALCRELAAHGAAQLLMIDLDENGLEANARPLGAEHPGLTVCPELADVRDYERLRRLVQRHRPQVVLHAAAYANAGLMEEAPEEAVRTNVFGTLNVAVVAHEVGVEQLVAISSDRAANPRSIVGATRRIAELVVCDLSRRSGTRMSAVRVGSMLASASVVSVFRQQIERGGPVTVSHPHATRSYLKASDAAGLVLLAAADDHGEVCVLDAGEPLRIADLAANLVTLSGHAPDTEIPIVFTGLRPGERLHDQLVVDDDESTVQLRRGISVVHGPPPPRDLSRLLHELQEHALAGNRDELVVLVRQLVPTWRQAPGEQPASSTPIGSIQVRRTATPAPGATSSPVPAPALAVVSESPDGAKPLRLPGAGWLQR